MKTSANAFRDYRRPPSRRWRRCSPARGRAGRRRLELIGRRRRAARRAGRSPHLNARARGLLGGDLVLSGGRLRARDHARDRTLATAIGSTLRDQVASRRAQRRNARRRSRNQDHAGDGDADDSFQLLRAVAILEPRGAPARSGLAGLN